MLRRDQPFIPCPQCSVPLPEVLYNAGHLTPCPECSTLVQVEVFPAFYEALQPGSAGERIVVEGEAGCFNHPDKRAVTHCEACGRFLCALCDMDLEGQHLCPTCLANARGTGRLCTLENSRTLYSHIAFALAVLPILFWPVSIFTAPVAIGYALYGWNKPQSLVGHTRVWAVLAILVALGELGAWGAILFSFWLS